MDTKKKEMVGPFKNNGREWEPKGQPVRVDTHDFPDPRAGQGGALRHLRCRRQHGLGQRGHRPRHRGVRGRVDPPLVERSRAAPLSGGRPFADHRRCGRLQRVSHPHLEDRARPVRSRVRPDGHRLPPVSRNVEVEPDRAPAVLPHHHELARQALTSHEVIVESIAATTTKTGLAVHAELDTGQYPTGSQVSDDEIAALPITRHRFHGDRNYTLHPQHPMDAMAVKSTSGQAPANKPHRLTRHWLQDPELTGMTRQQLSGLIDALTPALEVQREQVLRTRRGHERLAAPGAGAKAKLTTADRILVTVLHLRKLAKMDLLGQLFGVTAPTISRAKQEVGPLLEAHGHHITAFTARFRTPSDVATFLASKPT
ncbi:transposase family protein [Streptomyces sp. TRM68367]|nr:transposase family protein [Streptomyces sp. TRM68367]